MSTHYRTSTVMLCVDRIWMRAGRQTIKFLWNLIFIHKGLIDARFEAKLYIHMHVIRELIC